MDGRSNSSAEFVHKNRLSFALKGTYDLRVRAGLIGVERLAPFSRIDALERIA